MHAYIVVAPLIMEKKGLRAVFRLGSANNSMHKHIKTETVCIYETQFFVG